jgi:hypothetical protein
MAGRRNRVQLGICHGAGRPTSSVDSRTSSMENREWKEHGVLSETTGNNPTEHTDPRNLAMPQLQDMRVVFSGSCACFWESPKHVGKKHNGRCGFMAHSTSARHVGFRGMSNRSRFGSDEVIDKDNGKNSVQALNPCKTDSAFVK